MVLLERGALLDDLAQRLARARHGRGSNAFITGEAGAGKTSLVRAFVDDRSAPALILSGACDPILPARPFAPVKDMAEQVPGLARALDAGHRDAVFDSLLGVMRRPGAAVAVVVFEDLHWADEPTLDLLRVLGRRIVDLRALVIGTYRDDEVSADHALSIAIGDLPRDAVATLPVPPLSIDAVARLARGAAIDPSSLHAASGGNAFFVTEAIQAADERVPASVRDAVAARVARLPEIARRALDAAAVLGYPAPAATIAAVAGVDDDAVETTVDRGLLVRAGELVTFRHELARLAILERLGAAARRGIHVRALGAERAGPSPDSTRLAGHAIGAADGTAIRELVPSAATRAARLGAHREAAWLLDSLIRAVDRPDAASKGETAMPPSELAALLERHAEQASLADDVAAALISQRRAVELWQRVDDPVRVGNARSALATLMWFAGQGAAAVTESQAAVAILEASAPRSPELARALGVLAQRITVSNLDDAAGLAAGRRALDLAEELGLEEVAVHALITIGSIEANPELDPEGLRKMEEAARRASAAGIHDQAIRALINLLETAYDLWQLDAASEYAVRAEALLGEAAPENFVHARLLRTRQMQIGVDRGRWDEVVRAADELLALPVTANQVRVRALTSLGLVRARRGEAGATRALDEAVTLVGEGELQDRIPVLAAMAEAAFLAGDVGAARDASALGLRLARHEHSLTAWWWWGHVAFWAWRTGAIDRLPPDSAPPYVLEEAGRHADAAAAWADLGFVYQQARALAGSSEVAEARRGLDMALELGARPLARFAAGRMRALGVDVIPRGPRPATRRNPAGLTVRELEILRHLRSGAANAEIAASLTLSPKTVDHHVSAILRKLGARNRGAAAREADRLGL